MSAEEGWKNKLYYGDNLDVMRQHVQDESVDLIYLDPPFKSNINYNLLFRADGLSPDEAQWTAFKDTWLWDEVAACAFAELQDVPNPMLVGIINAFHEAMPQSPMFAYLVNMALRLLEMRKKLNITGSIYLHCDPTASHYLKIILDAVFDPRHFKNEIIWKRTSSHNRPKKWGPVHDVIFFYTASQKFTWNQVIQDYSEGYVEERYTSVDSNGQYLTDNLTGPGLRKGPSGQSWRGIDPGTKQRHWELPPDRSLPDWFIFPDRYSEMSVQERLEVLDGQGLLYHSPRPGGFPRYKRYLRSQKGIPIQDVILDVFPINSMAQERLGYPTQKPEALLERMINASSNEGDLVLDPFCGCGTTIAVAQRLRRRWIGIDISPFAIELIRKKRLGGAFPGHALGRDYVIEGLPTTIDGARLLAEQDKKAFEVWAVSQIDGIPNEKKGPDKGIDGRVPFKPDGKITKFAVVSVKGGYLKADDVRALAAVAKRQESSSVGFGILVTLHEPTKGMRADAAGAGTATINGKIYQLVQILTIEEILHGKEPRLPFLDKSDGIKKAPLDTGIQKDWVLNPDE